MDDEASANLKEELLAHEPFVRGLARRLLQDESQADDLLQETWLAALRRPPTEQGSLRTWVARVSYNLAVEQHRVRERRRRREREVARAEAVPSAAQILEHRASCERLVHVVLSLAEPYRTAVLLRYYESLSPPELARRLGVPLETVRTRLKRGLQLLRARLDANSSSGRRGWSVALLPLAGLDDGV